MSVEDSPVLTFEGVKRAFEQLRENNPGPRGDGYYVFFRRGLFIGPFKDAMTDEDDARIRWQSNEVATEYGFVLPYQGVMENDLPKPSELVARMSKALFLPDAFHNAESEQAAALVIQVCALKGDEWAGKRWSEIAEFIRPKLDDTEWRIFKNPFFRPSAFGLVERGYAVFEGEVGEDKKLTLSPLAIRRAARSLGLLGGREALQLEDVERPVKS